MAPIFSPSSSSLNPSSLLPPDFIPHTASGLPSAACYSGRLIWRRSKYKNQNSAIGHYSSEGHEPIYLGGELLGSGRREALVEMTVTAFYFPAMASGAAPLQKGQSKGAISALKRAVMGSPCQPQQVHVSVVGRDHMRVTWITVDKQVPSTVEYGKEPGRYEDKATGEHTSYKFMSYTSGKIHHVKIGPLEPDTTYYYTCGGHAAEFSMKTPPATFPVEFAVVGDLGRTSLTKLNLEHVNRSNYDVFLLPGDLSYADCDQPSWDKFGRLVEPLASSRPWMVTEGNHEMECIFVRGSNDFKAYNARWRMPYEESGSPSNLYYSFDVAGAHVVMLGSYAEFMPRSAQHRWLINDLARVDRKRTPWLIVCLHDPWYNTNYAHSGEGEDMRKAMEGLLYKARVDVVFAGHVHAYERFTRVYNNNADPRGPVYITIGTGGNHEGLELNFKTPGSRLSLYREAQHGHGRLRIVDERRAHWSWHRINDSEEQPADEVWLDNLAS
ncbi:unnamed protein product [Linum tenue]|uniref:Purple acid phosphatase n=1 Tax=Linum tenue TaxID=586396 RepID=A0AAV0KPY5_9ROSI|nr:unnamed protein product [Linum tenue]